MIGSSSATALPSGTAGRGWRAAPFVLIAALTIASIAFYPGPMCPDVSGQFWIAHMMRGGVRLYVDFVEMNPPLWFWLAMPIDWAAEAIGMRYEVLTIVAVALGVAAAVRAIDPLLPFERRRRAFFLLYLVAAVMIIPLRYIEQREHLAVIAALPYFILAAARRRGAAVDARPAALIGLFAGIGLSLKPHFLAGPMLIELWLALALRRGWRPFRAETLAMAAAVIAYLAAIVIFTPAYLTVTLPELLGPYQAISPSLSTILSSFTPALWLVLLTGVAPMWRTLRGGEAPVAAALLIGAAGFSLAWLFQHKGWLYQGMPATVCLALALAALLIERRAPLQPWVRIVFPCLLCLPLATATLETEARITPATDISPALADLRRGDAFALISTGGAASWPALVDRGLRLSTRYGQFWMMRLLNTRPRDPAAVELVQRAIRETAADLRCLPPKVVVFIRVPHGLPRPHVSNDPYPYFMREPAFAAVMSHYRPDRSGEIYDSYRLETPFAPFDRSGCRRGP